MTALMPGIQAPDFSLATAPDQKVALSDFRGRPVVLVFYPADWSPVCSDQLSLYNELRPEFSEFDAQVVGISVDGVWCHLAFSKDRKLQIPLLADFQPKGAAARQQDGSTGKRTASRSVPCSPSTARASFVGAMSRRWASTRAPTASSKRSK